MTAVRLHNPDAMLAEAALADVGIRNRLSRITVRSGHILALRTSEHGFVIRRTVGVLPRRAPTIQILHRSGRELVIPAPPNRESVLTHELGEQAWAALEASGIRGVLYPECSYEEATIYGRIRGRTATILAQFTVTRLENGDTFTETALSRISGSRAAVRDLARTLLHFGFRSATEPAAFALSRSILGAESPSGMV